MYDGMDSVASIVELLSHAQDIFLAIANVLVPSIAHLDSLTPDTNDESLSSNSSSGTTTTLSGKGHVVDAIIGVLLHEHVLLVADSKTALLRLATAFLSSLDKGGVFIAHHFLG